ncbi:hypothetical protein Tco_0612201 [Tanacetum coccineum]
MHQPWRTFAAVINRCISRKTTGLDKLRLSKAQILWGMYHCKNVDFVKLLWEDFIFQIDNYFSKESMPYLRFTKIIINHFISQNKSISIRNRINLYTTRDDSLLGTLKYVSKTEEHHVYGALIPKEMLNEDILNSTPTRLTILSHPSPKEPTKKPGKAKKDVTSTKKIATKPKPTKKKTPIKADRGQSGSSDGTDFESRVPDEQQGDSREEDDDVDDTEDDDNDDGDDNDGNNDDDDSDHERTEFDRDENLNLNQSNEEHKEDEEEYVDEFSDKENDVDNANEENEEELDDVEELYKDVNVNLRKADVEMTDADQGGADQHNVSQESGFEQEEEDAHVTLTALRSNDTHKTEVFSLKRSQDDKDKDQDPSAGSDRGMKRRKSSKSAHTEEKSHTVNDSGVRQNQEFNMGNNDKPEEQSVPMQRSKIEDLVLNLWNPVKVIYDKHAYLGTSHWGSKRQRFYGFASNMTSSKDVYSRRRIIAATRFKIMKMYDYGHLEEIEVRRDYQQLYTSYSDPHGVIYVDSFDRKRLMRADKLHKFSDGTLNDVQTTLHFISSGIRMEYMPKKKWSNLDKRRGWVMVQDIEKQLFERRLMRNLEKFIRGREYGNDLRLLEWTI